MDREKCMKIVIEQLNQIKPLMSIDPEVSLLGDKYNFDSNDIILFCLQLKKHFDIDLGSFIKKANDFKISEIVNAIMDNIHVENCNY